MSRYSIHSARLLDRPWRCGHPFRPHRGRFRRIGMALLFFVLTLVISGYTYLTDSNRVRDMAAAYLSKLVGGRVEFGRASLSIFEGLRIDDVKVHVDQHPGQPDSLLFSAQAFVISYDPRKLIAGQLEATEIVAQKPHVYLTLTQLPNRDQWNYHRLRQDESEPRSRAASAAPHKVRLPQVLLRNAVVEISEVKAGQALPVGKMYIDGQLTPVGDGERYNFELQTRGLSEGLGPYSDGTVRVADGALDARLHNVQFGEDIRCMFPAALRDWWERHELSGRIKAVDVNYTPPRGRAEPKFRITTTVEGVTLAVHHEEWSSREEVERWQRLQNSIGLLRGTYRVAGFSVRNTLEEGSGFRVQGRSEAGIPTRRGSGIGGPLGEVFTLQDQHPDPAASSPVEVMASLADASPLRLRAETGTFVFTQDGIGVDDLQVKVGAGDPDDPRKTNAFIVAGHMDGYSPDAPLRLEIASADPEGLYFPAQPKFLDSLPRDVRDFYNDLKPQGTCFVKATIDRPQPGAMPQVNGEVEIVDAHFFFRQFPYPFRGASGKIAFGRDPFSGKNYVTVMNMHGRGMKGGPNERAEVSISGRVGPIGPDSPEPGFHLHATGKNLCSELALMAALPPQVREALKVFDAPREGAFPQFKANFSCDIVRPPGARQRWTFDTDLDLLDAAGRVVGFPYPLKHANGQVKVRDGYVDVVQVTIPRGAASAVVSGRVRWADDQGRDQPLDMNLTIAARSFAVDKDLLGALPVEQGAWLKKLGIGGRLNVNGRIFTTVPPDWRASVAPGEKPRDPPILYDLNIGVSDGTIWPADGLFSLSAVSGKLHLTHDRLDLLGLYGRRENAEVAARGSVTFIGRRPQVELHASVKNLSLDRPLYAILSADAKKAWDEVQPRGTADAQIDYRGAIGPKELPAVASASPQVELPPDEEDSFRAVLRPRNLSVRLKSAPYPLTFSSGRVTITPGTAVLDHLAGTHGRAKLVISGTGRLGGAPDWLLSIQGQNMPADEELRRAMPAALLAIVDGLKLHGNLGLDIPKLSYRGSLNGTGDPDIDVTGTLTISGGSMDVGMPLTDAHGGMEFQAASRQGQLDSLAGAVTLDSVSLGGRAIRDLKLELLKPSGRDELHVDKVRAKVARGELAGNVLISFPDQGPTRYNMNLVVRNADVKELTGEKGQDIRGELTASLALEGAWGEVGQRRGRGDVVVGGRQLYQIPLMLGLLQITNLSLPLGGPFTKGTARYSVDGTRVNFEQMDLRSDSMIVTGNGYLDFGTRKVSMTLTTDNAAGLKIPFINDLWQGARRELFRINVRGTVQAPKVEPTSMGIFTTTIDEVFKGDNGRK